MIIRNDQYLFIQDTCEINPLCGDTASQRSEIEPCALKIRHTEEKLKDNEQTCVTPERTFMSGHKCLWLPLWSVIVLRRGKWPTAFAWETLSRAAWQPQVRSKSVNFKFKSMINQTKPKVRSKSVNFKPGSGRMGPVTWPWSLIVKTSKKVKRTTFTDFWEHLERDGRWGVETERLLVKWEWILFKAQSICWNTLCVPVLI